MPVAGGVVPTRGRNPGFPCKRQRPERFRFPGTSRFRVPTPAPRRQRAPLRGVGVLACLDSFAAVAAIIGVFISVNLDTLSGGIDSFLSARITVKNILLLIALATTWPVLFKLFRLYDARVLQRFGSEIGRLFLATSAGTAVALIFPLTSVSGSVTISDLRHFWLVSFGSALSFAGAAGSESRAQRPR